MNELLQRLTDAYAASLRAYLEGHGEEALLKGYDIGREAVASKLSVLEMTAVHQVALVRTLLARLAPEESRKIADMAAEFSAESLLPFELKVRGTHEANAILQQLNETLESKNALIARQLDELRILQALKDDLTSLVVHDLRNPLAGMISCLDLLKPSPGDPNYESTREIVTLAREGARKLSELVDDMLEVRKLEEGKIQLKKEPVVVADLAHDAIATLEPTARLEDVRIELVVESDPALALDVDPRLMRRVVENLVSNAIKFTAAGSAVTITIRSLGDRLALEVADRGPGVAEELRDRLFQKFGSVEAKARGGRRGFGLGLYFVKLVATAHGGTVEAEARSGGGAVFRVVLPTACAIPDGG